MSFHRVDSFLRQPHSLERSLAVTFATGFISGLTPGLVLDPVGPAPVKSAEEAEL